MLRLSHQLGEWTIALEGDQVRLANVDRPFVVREEADGRWSAEGPAGPVIVTAARSGNEIWIGCEGHALLFRVETDVIRPRSSARDQDGLSPPMSATVVRVAVRAGDRVAAGDTLVVLEAMKMELPIRAPRDGVVRAVHCAEGQLVQPGVRLIELV
jgi:biotin carboxyl carrier protein